MDLVLDGGVLRDVRHIVWDWNGTILDDSHAVIDSVNAVCADYGRDPIDLAYWRSIYRRPVQASYQDLLGIEVTADDWARIDRVYHDAYRALLATCRLASGVPDELRRWSATGRGQSLLSMWFHHELVPLVTRLGLAELFARVDGQRVGIGGGGGSKAEHLAEHLAAQNLNAADVVVIGDVADDAAAAASVGARCVLVTTGVMDGTTLRALGVPVVDSITDALTLIS